MRIAAERQIISSNTERTCEISAGGGSFTLDIQSDIKKPIHELFLPEYDEVEAALVKNGFRCISPELKISNPRSLNDSPFPTKNLESAFTSTPLTAELNIDFEQGETLVAIEFNPATGAILDWYQADAEIMPLPVITRTPIKVLMETTITPVNRATFSIPLHTTYSPELEAYIPTKLLSFKPKKIFKKIIKIFAIKKLEKYAHAAIGKVLTGPVRLLDRSFVKLEKFGRINQKGRIKILTPKDKKAMVKKRVLLLVHGIISSSNGAFSDLLEDKDSFESLNAIYDGNILAYDHWTLSKDVFQNAKAIASALPSDITLDIVCHSRGAAVVRSLLELPNNQEILRERKRISVRKVIFVAGACEGSDVANKNALDNLFRVFGKMGSLLGKPAFSAIVAVKAIKLILGGLQKLPGTDSVKPNGKYIGTLKVSESTLANEYLYIRSNFDPDNVAAAFVDQQIIDKAIFSSKANDVVVPFAGAGGSKGYLNGKVKKTLLKQYGTTHKPTSDVWHTTFFSTADVRAIMIKALSK